MRLRLRIPHLLLAACAVFAAYAGQAQAYVYWTVGGPAFGSSGTTIGRADLDGSGVTHALITRAGTPEAIAVDASHIYWANALTRSIGRANLDGSAADPTWIQLNNPPAGDPADLALDATHIYWTDGSQNIGRANLDGSGITEHFINTAPWDGPQGIAIAGATIYFGAGPAIVSVPVTGGSPTPVGTLAANTHRRRDGCRQRVSVLDLGGPLSTPPANAIGRWQLSAAFPPDPTYIPNLYLPGGVATDGTYLYWTDDYSGHLHVGRALIGTQGGATNINDNFIDEPGGPVGIAVDAGIDPTKTSLACTPPSVPAGTPTTCTATVTDSTSSAAPTGTVNLTGNGAAFFSGNPCTLTPVAGGASCVVGAVPTTAGNQSFHAAYLGDAIHSPSSGDVGICAGTVAVCGTVPPPPPAPPAPPPNPPTKKPICTVPKLKGKTLTSARKLLAAAHCALGKVTRPRARKHHPLGALVVGSQKPGAGATLGNGSKVAVVLVNAPRRATHRRPKHR